MAQADLLPNSYYCHTIDNINDYPDFVFFANSPGRLGFKINIHITDSFCEIGSIGKAIYLYAINKKDVSQAEIESALDRPKAFFYDNNRKTIRADLPLSSSEIDPGDIITTHWRINKLTTDEFIIEKGEVIYEDIEKEYGSINYGEAKWYSWFTDYWHFIVPGLALITIILMTLIRKK